MSGINDFIDEEEEDDFPISFIETVGDHAITDGIRRAIVWASIQKFLSKDKDKDAFDLVDIEDFTESERSLSKHISFHGPFTNIADAVEDSKRRRGIIVAPRNHWSEDNDEFVFIAVLTN